MCCAVAKPASLTDAAAPASTGAAPSRNAGVAQRPAHAARKSPGRVVVVAVDGTDEGVESLHWLAENCFKAGVVPRQLLVGRIRRSPYPDLPRMPRLRRTRKTARS